MNDSRSREIHAARTIHVHGLPHHLTEDYLHRYFQKFGKINDIESKKGFAFVKFEDAASARSVLNFSPHRIDGQTVNVKAYEFLAVLIKMVPPNFQSDEITREMSKFGKVSKVSDPKEFQDVRVVFCRSESVKKALDTGFIYVQNKKLSIEPVPLKTKSAYKRSNSSQSSNQPHQMRNNEPNSLRQGAPQNRNRPANVNGRNRNRNQIQRYLHQTNRLLRMYGRPLGSLITVVSFVSWLTGFAQNSFDRFFNRRTRRG